MAKRKPYKRRLVRSGEQPHHRYGKITINYVDMFVGTGGRPCINIGWLCKLGFGVLGFAQKAEVICDESLGLDPHGGRRYRIEARPGMEIDTEYMGAEFVGEVMKALAWAQERGDEIPESCNMEEHRAYLAKQKELDG